MGQLLWGKGHSTNLIALISALGISTMGFLPQDRSSAILISIALSLFLPLFMAFFLKPRQQDQLGLVFILLASFICSTSFPLFENDHFRYLFEGLLVSSGENPYFISPASSSITFKFQHLIGYSHLTSPYPILAHIYFAVATLFFDNFEFLPMATFNGLAVMWLLNRVNSKVSEFRGREFALCFLTFYLLREYVYSLHYDIFVFCSFFWAFENRRRAFSSNIGLAIASGLKLFGFFGVMLLIFERGFKNWRQGFFLLVGQLIIFSLLFLLGFFKSSGWVSFSSEWWFLSGLGSILQEIGVSTKIYLKYWRVLFGLLALGCVSLRSLGIWQRVLALFFCLLYLAPAYNSWYAIWVFVPALLVKPVGLRWCGILYGVGSCLCLLQHLEQGISYSLQISLVTHFFALVFFASFSAHLVTNHKKETS